MADISTSAFSYYFNMNILIFSLDYLVPMIVLFRDILPLDDHYQSQTTQGLTFYADGSYSLHSLVGVTRVLLNCCLTYEKLI